MVCGRVIVVRVNCIDSSVRGRVSLFILIELFCLLINFKNIDKLISLSNIFNLFGDRRISQK